MREFKKYSNVFELFEEIGFHHSEEEKAFIEAMSQIGGQLMAYRKKHNLTQKDLAKKLGISQSMVSKIETGEKNISIRVLTKIVAAFGGRVRISLGILPVKGMGLHGTISMNVIYIYTAYTTLQNTNG